LEFAERVGGLDSGVGKRLGKKITQGAEYAEPRREKSGGKKNERKEKRTDLSTGSE
jgi:hypothetical protein